MTNYYTEGQLVKFHEEKFSFLEIQETKDVLEIKLNRIAKKNAIHPQMLTSWRLHFSTLKTINKLGF